LISSLRRAAADRAVVRNAWQDHATIVVTDQQPENV
jgi:hypothetical protein